MATNRLTYDKDVKPLINKIQPQFKAGRGATLDVRNVNNIWYVNQIWGTAGQDNLCKGTLRECYCFLLGLAEFLI